MALPCIVFTSPFSLAQTGSVKSDIDKKVDALLKRMTLEEKVGQMNQYNGFWEITGRCQMKGMLN